MSDEATAILELAERLAREAGQIQRENYEGDFEIKTKSAVIDLVTDVDRACERLIVDGIRAQRPGDAILSEEGGGSDTPDADWRWVIDPLDGTTNYAHGYPRFCVSIGVEHRGIATLGVVYDPLLDELFSALRGRGAALNGRPLRVSAEARLDHAMLSTGFAYDVHSSDDDNLDHFAAFAKTAQAIRRDGSAALNLCYVAAGRFDGFWELKLDPWDVAAGCLIVEEAGGRTSDFSGRGPCTSGRETIASNALLHDAMVEMLQR
ncbi:MAG: inositol monophosphatase [Deltaproteobacteria bacterium]|jgi:myo-inositol-1(or 4)-monophosphatase|nr:inositol monophosphatase [Deltaproteobacteria bacterium]